MSRAAPSLRPSGRRSSTQPLRRLQSPVFGLEINGRPSKRPLLDFENLSISETLHKEELKTKKIFVQHVETLRSSDATVAIVQSFVVSTLVTCGKKTLDLSIWRSRKGVKDEKDDHLHDVYHIYDIIRLDTNEISSEAPKQEQISLEDQSMLSSYLPLLREFIPSAAAEIE
ncbi:RNA-directed DNA methylation 4 isoform X1 [Cucumis melo]|uniref:RNA-directed DNA methylation 4 isoform X1 n=1 Tax=Cucumis melo TaxID=3656 RepID=A0ABM3KJF0_CUCME|nr:RNA-directed DNA methylation 4 isoform X1 [Cucumis melo]